MFLYRFFFSLIECCTRRDWHPDTYLACIERTLPHAGPCLPTEPQPSLPVVDYCYVLIVGLLQKVLHRSAHHIVPGD